MSEKSQNIISPAMSADQIAELQKLCAWANSYTRAEVLLENCPFVLRGNGRVHGTEWFKVLGQEWSTCDNIGDFRLFFRMIFKQASPAQLQAMMSEEEREKWRELPDTIHAWRGCEAKDRTGLSFSLSESIARKFPFLRRYRAKAPALVSASIPKETAVLKLDRDEEEIISAFPTIKTVEPLISKEAA